MNFPAWTLYATLLLWLFGHTSAVFTEAQPGTVKDLKGTIISSANVTTGMCYGFGAQRIFSWLMRSFVLMGMETSRRPHVRHFPRRRQQWRGDYFLDSIRVFEISVEGHRRDNFWN